MEIERSKVKTQYELSLEENFCFFLIFYLSNDTPTVKVSFPNSESWDKNMDC